MLTGSILLDITKLERSSLEIAENLEQLRWLQNNYVIKNSNYRI
jgi:3-deoxy-manno-octulosonate cytidylyltransferase (CMP-KDO synthetase)